MWKKQKFSGIHFDIMENGDIRVEVNYDTTKSHELLAVLLTRIFANDPDVAQVVLKSIKLKSEKEGWTDKGKEVANVFLGAQMILAETKNPKEKNGRTPLIRPETVMARFNKQVIGEG